jgi:hypothetical protein
MLCPPYIGRDAQQVRNATSTKLLGPNHRLLESLKTVFEDLFEYLEQIMGGKTKRGQAVPSDKLGSVGEK